MNQSKPPLDNVNVRKALSISILRDVIGPDVLGTGELPAYGWVPPGTANYEGTPYAPDWAEMPYDQRVEEAKKLMADAGYTPENPLKLQLRYNTNENHQRIAVAITDMWKQIGVEVELFNAETAVHYDALRAGDFQVGRAGWLMDYNDASNTLDLLRTGTMQDGAMNWGNNYGRYSDPKFDDLMNKAATELDLTKRAELHAPGRRDRDGRIRRDPDLLVRVQERRLAQDHRLRRQRQGHQPHPLDDQGGIAGSTCGPRNRKGSAASVLTAAGHRRHPAAGGKGRNDMGSYALRRLLTAIPIVFITITVCFFILRLAPGGPFDGERALPPDVLRNLRALLPSRPAADRRSSSSTSAGCCAAISVPRW